MITKSDVEKKLKSMFKDAQFEVQVNGKSVKVAVDGVGETPGELFTKIGEFVESLTRLTGNRDVDVIVSMQGSAFGVEIEIY
ncbi:hypothetical protein [Infirmifilum sp. NZ]|uniref:hypothetical protein n=1 Tax=Infirmifilum sp. NZ TaxID=2926850 RepID=UPI0027993A7C|nr:hypothetical protein [Infirmifilum sp. NZ]UNQ72531.1 hypothetical protein MOV14_05215 [Infirmifilum sp. NZ]